ncbi:hypothetical protein M9458_038969, partial [Cirrhinus mrigala]
GCRCTFVFVYLIIKMFKCSPVPASFFPFYELCYRDNSKRAFGSHQHDSAGCCFHSKERSLLQTSEQPHLSAQLCRGSSLGKPGSQKSEFLTAVEDIFPVCLSGRALPGVVVSSPRWTDMNAASRAWADRTLRRRSRMVHLCPRGAATWRDRPHLPSRACKLLSALAGRAYHTAAQAATALHAMATLQVYQAQALKHLHESGPDQRVMQEPTSPSGRRRSRHVPLAIRRQSTLSRRSHLPGRPIRRHRRGLRPAVLGGPETDRGDKTHPAPPRQCHHVPGPATSACSFAEGAPLRPLENQLRPLPRPTTPDWQLDVELAAGERRRPRPRDRPGTPAGELRSIPDAGNPEVEEIALWGTTTPTSPLPVEGREPLCTQMLPSAYGSTVPTISQKESISSPLGSRPRVPFSSDALPPRIRTRSWISPALEPGKK